MIDQHFISTRSADAYWSSYFWCWSRKDYNETDLRQLPITMNFREEIFGPFSTSFFYNQTSKSVQCNSSEEWAKNWTYVGGQWPDAHNVPCSTNIYPIASFDWDPMSRKL